MMNCHLFPQFRFYTLITTAIFLMISMSANAQQTARSFVAYESLNIGYLEYLPPGYNESTKKFPVIIYLHGGGELGLGTPEDLELVKSWGPPSHIKNGHDMCFTVNGERECFIVISPQLSNVNYNWDYIVRPVIDHILAGPDQYKADPERIYLTGLSRGGKGVYNYAASSRNKPNMIAAIAPMAAWSDENDPGCVISRRKIPIWAFHGELDHIVTHGQGLTAFNSVKFCSNPEPTEELIFTTYPGRYHDAWIPGYDPAHEYHNPNVYEWFLQKRRVPLEQEVTGTEEGIDYPNSISIYPNPFYDELILTAETAELPDEVRIFNLTGAVVLVAKNKPEHIELSHLSMGVYVLRYTDSVGSIHSKRIMKVR